MNCTGPRWAVVSAVVSLTVTLSVITLPATEPWNREGREGPTYTGYARSTYCPGTSNRPAASSTIAWCTSPKVQPRCTWALVTSAMRPALSQPHLPVITPPAGLVPSRACWDGPGPATLPTAPPPSAPHD